MPNPHLIQSPPDQIQSLRLLGGTLCDDITNGALSTAAAAECTAALEVTPGPSYLKHALILEALT